jgi:hypothetical protein
MLINKPYKTSHTRQIGFHLLEHTSKKSMDKIEK